ncbi:MAG: 50S ribosomal protein L11 methyltransferase [Clostridia bacterium]|nr:50S ribosomal protein L11 methyltransferase [Clostridia bacterium]
MNIVKRVTVYTTSAGSELVADILYGAGSEGVGIYDSEDFKSMLNSDIIWDYVDESALAYSEVVRVAGFFSPDFNVNIITEALQELKSRSETDLGSLEINCDEADADAWIDIWKSYARPIREGKIVILPEWTDCGFKSEQGDIIIRLDPGMAFGTGEHETTRLCLRLLQDVIKTGDRVLDIGTGSGILAIAAAKLGASEVDACDIDAQAVDACIRNCKVNGVADKVNAAKADLTSAARGKYDVVLGNITADILMRLSNDIGDYTASGASTVVSGIIHSRADDVEQAYTKAGFNLAKTAVLGEWRAYVWK